jgi:hypothetical protein
MTTMPARHDLRPTVADASPPLGHWDFTLNETCSILTGWTRRDAVLRQLSRTHAVIGGVIGLRPGDCLRLVLYRGQTIVRECRVVGTSLQGVEIEHFDTGMLATMS